MNLDGSKNETITVILKQKEAGFLLQKKNLTFICGYGIINLIYFCMARKGDKKDGN